jgi:hypothetical protein
LDRAESGVTQERTTPEFYQEAFTTGKGAKTAGVVTDMLRKFKTKNSAAANALADLADQLRTRYNRGERPAEFGVEKPAPVQPEEVPAPKTEIAKDVEPPKPTSFQPAEETKVPQPERPKFSDVLRDIREKVAAKGRKMQEWGNYDIRRVVYPTIAGILAGHTLSGFVTGAAFELARFPIGELYQLPSVQNFIARATIEDVRAVQSLPANLQLQMQQDIQGLIDHEQAANRAVRIAPEIRGWLSQHLGPGGKALGSAGAAYGAVQNRQDGYDRAINPNK